MRVGQDQNETERKKRKFKRKTEKYKDISNKNNEKLLDGNKMQ